MDEPVVDVKEAKKKKRSVARLVRAEAWRLLKELTPPGTSLGFARDRQRKIDKNKKNA